MRPTNAPEPTEQGPSAFRLFTDPHVRHAIAREQVFKGLPGPDRRHEIPAIYQPRITAVGEAEHLADTDRVLGVMMEGMARAYPVKVLDCHEVVNDTLAGVPILVSYCPLCASGVVFDRRPAAAAGSAKAEAAVGTRTLTFGVSEYLYQSDLLMWDHETESFWSQMEGSAVVGPLTDATLPLIGSVATTWDRWRTEHPDTTVLVGPQPAQSYADRYAGGGDLPMDPAHLATVLHRDGRFDLRAIVTGIRLTGKAKAYPHSELAKRAAPFQDTVAGQRVQIRYEVQSDACRIFDAQGNELPVLRAFWFAWYTFHPDTAVFRSGA